MIPSRGRVLGVDWGTLRTGLALSDETQTLATPLATLVRRPGKRFPMVRLLELVARHEPVGVVVGLPLLPSGEEGESAGEARALADQIRRRTALPLELADERLSTARALRSAREQRAPLRGRRNEVDSAAAAVLLQGWLDARRGSLHAAD